MADQSKDKVPQGVDEKAAEQASQPSTSGRNARTPSEIPKRGWWEIARRVQGQMKLDHLQIVAAGVAFYFFLALFPTLAAVISVYGLVTSPAEVQHQLDEVGAFLPRQMHELLDEVATAIVGKRDATLGWGLAVSIVLSIWSANKGTKALFEGLNIAYNEEEKRGFIKLNLITLSVTVAALCALVFLLTMVAGVPAVLNLLEWPGWLEWLISLARWPVLAAVLMVFLGFVYRLAPDRDPAKWRWLSWGSAIATFFWLVGSAGFSLYVDNFGKFADSYGSLAAVIILMLWFVLTAFIVLLGAEINSEMEHQTEVDTTVGPEQPMGERGAYYADHVAGDD